MARSAACALLGLVLMAGCGGDGADRAASPTSTAPPRSTTTLDRAAEEQAVIDAYLRQLDAFYAAANPPNPDHPALAETSTGRQLDSVRALLSDLRTRNVGVRRSDASTHRPRVVRVTRTAAVLEDCGVDADTKVDLDSGAVVDDTVVEGLFTAELISRDGSWLVIDSSFVEQQCVG